MPYMIKSNAPTLYFELLDAANYCDQVKLVVRALDQWSSAVFVCVLVHVHVQGLSQCNLYTPMHVC
jgi:hypothetical protein